MSASLEHATNGLEEIQLDMLANISHGVRTPLHTIMGMTDLALAEVNDSEAVTNYLHKIKNAGEILTGQLNDLLELTRLQKNEIEVKQEICTYESIARMAGSLLKLCTEDRKLETEIHVEDMTRASFFEDTVKLEQILANVISNAAKYTPDGGKITVTAETLTVSEDRIRNRYTVTDNGIGMSETFQDKLFVPFMKEDNAFNMNMSGAGLGLYMVKQFVELMHGSVNIDSHTGKGTKVVIELVGSVCKGEDKTTIVQTDEDISILEGKRILLCEDNELNAEMTKDLLENAGMLVDLAANGQEAVDRIQGTPPYYYDAVLMDIRMPVMNGLEATDRIRRMDREDTYMIPVVALTASAYEMDHKKALAAGMDAFLGKPFDIQTLLQQLAGFWHVYKEQL